MLPLLVRSVWRSVVLLSVLPAGRSHNLLKTRTLPHTRCNVPLWFQASPSPPAGAAAASPRCWLLSLRCLSPRRKTAPRQSTCPSWSTKHSLWWVPHMFPTVPSRVVQSPVIALSVAHWTRPVLFLSTGHQEPSSHQSFASGTRKRWIPCNNDLFKRVWVSGWPADLDRSGVDVEHLGVRVRRGDPACDQGLDPWATRDQRVSASVGHVTLPDFPHLTGVPTLTRAASKPPWSTAPRTCWCTATAASSTTSSSTQRSTARSTCLTTRSLLTSVPWRSRPGPTTVRPFNQ